MASCRIREVRLAKIVNTVFRSFTFQPAFHRGYRIRLSDSAQMQCSLIPMALRPDPNTQVPAALETQHKQRSWQTRQRQLDRCGLMLVAMIGKHFQLQTRCSFSIFLASRLEAIAIGWRPSLLGWRPSQLGWRPLLLGWRPSLLGWRPSLSGWRPSLSGWRPSLLGWRPRYWVGGHRS